MKRPNCVVAFELLTIVSLVLGIVLSWNDMFSVVSNTRYPYATLSVSISCFLITLLITYGISRRGSSIAAWIGIIGGLLGIVITVTKIEVQWRGAFTIDMLWELAFGVGIIVETILILVAYYSTDWFVTKGGRFQRVNTTDYPAQQVQTNRFEPTAVTAESTNSSVSQSPIDNANPVWDASLNAFVLNNQTFNSLADAMRHTNSMSVKPAPSNTSSSRACKALLIVMLLSIISAATYVSFFKKEWFSLLSSSTNASIIKHVDWSGNWFCDDQQELQIYPHAVIVSGRNQWNNQINRSYYRLIEKPSIADDVIPPVSYYGEFSQTKSEMLKQHQTMIQKSGQLSGRESDLVRMSNERIKALRHDNYEALILQDCTGCDGVTPYIKQDDLIFGFDVLRLTNETHAHSYIWRVCKRLNK